jgi:hypothetical protein
MVKVKHEELLTAFEFVSIAGPWTNDAYISLETGQIHWISEDLDADEELPADIDDSDRYIAVPNKHDLDLGTRLVKRFADQKWPERFETIQAIFRHRGAYARFRELLAQGGRLEQWRQFEADATARALDEWCAENGIEVDRT